MGNENRRRKQRLRNQISSDGDSESKTCDIRSAKDTKMSNIAWLQLKLIVFLLAPAPWSVESTLPSDVPCANNADCTNFFENVYCPFSTKPRECTLSTCACNAGYTEMDNICKRNIAVRQPCTASDYCMKGSECRSGICTCTVGMDYNSKLDKCIPLEKKLIGEICTTVGDCYNQIPGVTCCAGRCQCMAGYEKDGYTCTLPALNEECTSAGCSGQGSSLLSGLTTLSCVANHCSCPAGYLAITVQGFYVCKKSGNLKAGDPCASYDDCTKTLICHTCPNTTTGVCTSFPTSRAPVHQLMLERILPIVTLFLIVA